MKQPIAVLVSDVHYNIHTLPLADKAMRLAIDKANELNVPLIVAGDLHDTKANLRGECVNAMVNTFAKDTPTKYILVGNHDKINEKANENSLNFLENPSFVISSPEYSENLGLYLIPYQHEVEKLKAYLKTIPKGSIVIMHQGLIGSNMGDYIQDKTAISVNDVAGLRVISGHYHNRQTIKLPNNGTWDYIGNPYSLSFGEANDPSKGFQILYNDGSLEFVPTNLRKHVIIEITDSIILQGPGNYGTMTLWKPSHELGDLLWVKCYTKASRQDISKILGTDSFKLTYEGKTDAKVIQPKNLTQTEILDSIISNLDKSEEEKERLKILWKNL